MGRIGVWLVGARGSVSTVSIVGWAALCEGLCEPVGLVSAAPMFASAGLPEAKELVFGGCDLATTPLLQRAGELVQEGVIPASLLDRVAWRLAEAEADVVSVVDPGECSQLQVLERVRSHLEDFRARHRLERLVVVDCSTTEGPIGPDAYPLELSELRRAVGAAKVVLPASSLYAWAAFEAGCPFVEFTPSTGAGLPALLELAVERSLPHAGRDAKTGETLLKSALAPMFSDRALRVRSWAAVNLLGGDDGRTLSQSAPGEAKRRSKARVLERILGPEVEAPVHIGYVADLGHWKTAWDHVVFEGFLGTRMRLQLVWEGCDPCLAAPLVIDLARLVARADELGWSGPLVPLACFFKDPVGTDEQRFDVQMAMLRDFADELARATAR